MYHPTTRLLTVLELLQTRRAISGPELARWLDVNVRTVRRYIMMLQDLGIPIEAERGRYGRYRLSEGYKSRWPVIARDEEVALSLGLAAARRHRRGLAAYPRVRMPARPERAMMASTAPRLPTTSQVLVLDLFSRPETPTATMAVTFDHQPAATRPRIRLRYRSYSPPGDGALPWALFLECSTWYIVAQAEAEQRLQVAALAPVVYADLYDDAIADQATRHMVDTLIRAIGMAPAAWPVQALLETTLEDARGRVPSSPVSLEEAEGGVLLRCSTDDLYWMALFLNGLGCGFQIREPRALQALYQELETRRSPIAVTPKELPRLIR